jgi:hypothetical protein
VGLLEGWPEVLAPALGLAVGWYTVALALA